MPGSILYRQTEAAHSIRVKRRALTLVLSVVCGVGASVAFISVLRSEEPKSPPDPQPALEQCTQHMQILVAALSEYAVEHDSKLPPDLGSIHRHVVELRPNATEAERAKGYICPAVEKAVTAPDKLTREWINEKSSYAYLGGSDLSSSKFADASKLVIAYDKRDGAHDGRTVLGFLDGHCEAVDQKTAQRLIDQSKRQIEVVRNLKT